MRDVWTILLVAWFATMVGFSLVYQPDNKGVVYPTDEHSDYYPMGNTDNPEAKLWGWMVVDTDNDNIPDLSWKPYLTGIGAGAIPLSWQPKQFELEWWGKRHPMPSG